MTLTTAQQAEALAIFAGLAAKNVDELGMSNEQAVAAAGATVERDFPGFMGKLVADMMGA